MNPKFTHTESWFKTYKSLQVMVESLNVIFGSMLIPVAFNFIICQGVLSLYIVIGTNCTIQLKVVCVTFTLIILCYVHFVFMQCVKMTDQSATVIGLKKQELDLRTTIYLRRRFKTCFLLKLKVGPFHYMDRITIVIALNSIVDYTISLLLTHKQLK